MNSIRERLGLWLLEGTPAQAAMSKDTATASLKDLDNAQEHLNDLRDRLARVEAAVGLRTDLGGEERDGRRE